jgi:hypothetical protein
MPSTRLRDLHLLVARRRAALLPGLDLANLTGVEIGPLDAPLVTKSDGKILYVDHVGTEELRAKYAKYAHDVDVEDVVPVDVVWGEEPLPELIGRGSVDYVLASHVAEHVPNLIGWLQDMQAILKPTGQLRMILPDKRVSHDCLREETRVVDLLDAYVHQARKPQARQILDCALYVAREPFNPWKVYKGETRLEDVVPLHKCEMAMAIARDALENDKYVDVHCWTFTPRSFAGLMRSLVEYELIDFACAGFADSSVDLFEFGIFLQPCDDRAAAIASWRHMQETAAPDLPGSAAEASRTGQSGPDVATELDSLRGELAALRHERQLILNSTLWRATAPLRRIGRAVPNSIRRQLRTLCQLDRQGSTGRGMGD